MTWFYVVLIIIIGAVLFIGYVWLESLGEPEGVSKSSNKTYIVRLLGYPMLFKITMQDVNNYRVTGEYEGTIVYSNKFKMERDCVNFVLSLKEHTEYSPYINNLEVVEGTGKILGLPAHWYFLVGDNISLYERVDMANVLINTRDMNNGLDKIQKLELQKRFS